MRERMGLPPIKEEPKLNTPVAPPPAAHATQNNRAAPAARRTDIRGLDGDQRYTCLFWDCEDYPCACFCNAARLCECPPNILDEDEDSGLSEDKETFYILCWFWLCGYFSAYTLGIQSGHSCRTISMICYPVWCLCMLSCFLFELIVRVIIYGGIALFIIVVFVLPIALAALIIAPFAILVLCFMGIYDLLERTKPE